MTATATLTSKGQITLPIDIRRMFGFKEGDKLVFVPSKTKDEVTFRRRMTIDEVSDLGNSYIKAGVKPILNVDKYYQKNRTARV
jgi:AbrB family looped-hinge helix DNA binding protein